MIKLKRKPRDPRPRQVVAAEKAVRRARRVARVADSVSTVLVMLGLAGVAAFFWLTFSYRAGILSIGVSLIVIGVGHELDRKESHGIRKGANPSNGRSH